MHYNTFAPLLAWILYIVLLIGGFVVYPRGESPNYKPAWWGVVFWILVGMLVYGVFGSPFKG